MTESERKSVSPEDRKNLLKAAAFFAGAIAVIIVLKIILGY
jgi:hypothetical protein